MEGKAPVANVLPMEIRCRIIAALCEGNSVRGTSRLVEVDKGSVLDLGIRVGEGCGLIHNRLVRGLAAHFIQCDETWSFIHRKQARCDPATDPADWGDVYTFIAFDLNSKLVLSYHPGKRDAAHTDTFIADLRSRITVIPHVSTDGFSPYVEAIRSYFMGSVDFGQVVKNYRSGGRRDDHRYEPPRDPFITKKLVLGAPAEEDLCTSGVERVNLTLRHIIGRTRRLCLAFSKTLRGHRAAMSLGIFAYNFCRKHDTLGMTPAMAAGLTDHVWTMAELVTAALAEEPTAKPVAGPLALRPPRPGQVAPAARALPNGRGFLRAVPGTGGAPGASTSPAPPPASPAVAVAAVASVQASAPAVDDRQLDLLAWRPRPAPPVNRLPPGQLSLFGIDIDPTPLA